MPARSVLCIGGAVVDTILLAERPIRPGTSNPAAGARGFGGVARNVAVNLARLGIEASLCSVVGDDADGRALADDLARQAVGTALLRRDPGARTAAYVALLEPGGELHVGAADMAALDRIGEADADRAAARQPDWIFADCNCPAGVLVRLARLARGEGRLAVDAVSVAKAERLPARLDGIDLLFLNLDEAAAILDADRRNLAPATAVRGLHERGAAAVVLTLGRDGALAGGEHGGVHHIPAMAADVVDVTGAGDALIAGCLAGLLRGRPLPEAVRLGAAAAAHTLRWRGGTAPDLSYDLIAQVGTSA